TDIFGKTAARRLKPRRASHFLVRLTLRKSFIPAVETFAARDMMENDNPVSRLKVADSRTHGRNYARRLVAKDPRRRMRAGSDLLQVSATNSAGVYPQQDLTRADPGYRDGLHANIVYPAIDRRLHAGRNAARVFLHRE